MSQASKRAIIYVFSGTGNTFITAEKAAKDLSEKGIQTDLYRVCTQDSDLYRSAFYRSDINGNYIAECPASLNLRSNNEPVLENAIYGCLLSQEFGIIPDPNSYDLAGFAYPIHAFNTPQIFLRFVKQLPVLNPDKTESLGFIFKTSGEPFKPNASSSYTLAHFLKKKGYIPCIDMHILMPYNIMFRYPDAMAKQMYLHMETLVSKLADKVSDSLANAEDIQKLRFNPLITFMSFLFRIQWPAANLNGVLHKVKKSDCVGCGLCADHCPTGNIKMIDGMKHIPKIGSNCTMCMECTMICPKAAINPGFLTPWKVNPKWNFEKILNDEEIPSNWTDDPKAGYFKLFRKYFSETDEDDQPDITVDLYLDEPTFLEDTIIPELMDSPMDEDDDTETVTYKEIPLH